MNKNHCKLKCLHFTKAIKKTGKYAKRSDHVDRMS